MSDNDSKRYYWLKLKKDFFKRHDIRIIESMQNGKDYVLFYLKLMCESTSHNGELRFSELIPYNEEMLSTITNTNVDIVRQAIKLLVELKMLEILDDGTIYIQDMEKLIGSETGNAEKMRKLRYQRKESVTLLQNVTKCHQEKEIDIDKDKDNNSIGVSESKKRFVVPDIEEVKAYIKIKNLEYVNAEDFVNFYESKNWFVGKNKMTNWKSAVSGWNSRKKPKETNDVHYCEDDNVLNLI